MMTSTTLKILTFIIMALLLVSCASSPTRRNQFLLISPEAAILESETAYLSTVGALDEEGKLATDPNLMGRVGRITGRLVTIHNRILPHH